MKQFLFFCKILKRFSPLLVFILLTSDISAQTNTTPCAATILCQTSTFTNSYPAKSTPYGILLPCDSRAVVFERTIFYKIVVKNTGLFTFKIHPSQASDYDWALWKNLSHCSNFTSILPDRASANDGIVSQTMGFTTNWDTGMDVNKTFNCDPPGNYSNGFVSALTANAGDELLLAINLAQNNLSSYEISFNDDVPANKQSGFLCVEQYPNPFYVCDNNKDGFETVNMDEVKQFIIQNYLAGKTNTDITFYTDTKDILTETNQTSSTELTSAGTTVFCKIKTATDYQILSVNLILNTLDLGINNQMIDTCQDEIVELELQNQLPEETQFKWNTGETTRQIIISKSGIYKVVATLGACNDSAFFTVNFKPKLYATITDSVNVGEWYNKNGFSLPLQDIPGVFVDSLLLTGATTGCDSIVYLNLTVNGASPNTFTPNGDGINDLFLPNYHVQVFTRNGLLLYDGTNGWDGTYRGKPVRNDTYFYILYYQSVNGIKTRNGYVVVAR